LTCGRPGFNLQTLAAGQKQAPAGSKGIHGPQTHFRNLCVLLLSGLRRAGVFAELDSEFESRFQTTHPLQGAVGFSMQFTGGSSRFKANAIRGTIQVEPQL
jgi:hypothetical protein